MPSTRRTHRAFTGVLKLLTREHWRRRRIARIVVDRLIQVGALKPELRTNQIRAILATRLSSEAIETQGRFLVRYFEKKKARREARRKKR